MAYADLPLKMVFEYVLQIAVDFLHKYEWDKLSPFDHTILDLNLKKDKKK